MADVKNSTANKWKKGTRKIGTVCPAYLNCSIDDNGFDGYIDFNDDSMLLLQSYLDGRPAGALRSRD